MSGVTHGDMEFVRGDDAELGITKFPPKLMPDCGHLHSLCGLWRVLDRVNHSRSRQKKDNNDQNRDDGPGEFNLCASIHLRGLAPIIVEVLLQALLRLIREDSLAVVLVEQHAKLALGVTQSALVLNRGRIAYNGPSADLLADPRRLTSLVVA